MNPKKTYLKSFFAIILFIAVNLTHAIGIEDKAPNFSAKTLAGQSVSLQNDSMGDKPVLLIFWATWCPICELEIPEMNELHTNIGDRLSILAINIGKDDTDDKARKYQAKHSINYPIVFDEDSSITKSYAVKGTPTHIIIGTNGNIRYRGTKAPTGAEIEKYWDKLTAK
ncbi:MAG: TlpA family protein disulfide reductase [Proteobacteria bacterium]|nr:TlpA family protein disulfide reductase [Pseudomonadota bacterium]